MSSVTSGPSEYLRHFAASTQSVFNAILGWDLGVEGVGQGTTYRTGYDISGIISFSGDVQAIIVVSMDKEVAFAAAESFLGETFLQITMDVRDMVGELTNMIGGGAKDRINLTEIQLGVPTTVSGPYHQISFNPGALIESVIFSTPVGEIAVQIAVRK